MALIALEGIEWTGYHGLYPEERAKGNRFVLDLRATGSGIPFGGRLDGSWPDYVRMVALAESVFVQPRDLLEEVVTEILRALRAEWPEWTFEVSLTKMHPPITVGPDLGPSKIPSSRVSFRSDEDLLDGPNETQPVET